MSGYYGDLFSRWGGEAFSHQDITHMTESDLDPEEEALFERSYAAANTILDISLNTLPPEVDKGCVAFGMWATLTHFLIQDGWTVDDLMSDLHYHMAEALANQVSPLSSPAVN